MASTSTKVDIPPLTHGTKFSIWQIKMRAILISLDLHEALLEMDKMSDTDVLTILFLFLVFLILILVFFIGKRVNNYGCMTMVKMNGNGMNMIMYGMSNM